MKRQKMSVKKERKKKIKLKVKLFYALILILAVSILAVGFIALRSSMTGNSISENSVDIITGNSIFDDIKEIFGSGTRNADVEVTESNDCSLQDILCVDDTPGTTQEYTTIQMCLNEIIAGQSCVVWPGVYNETLHFPNPGTSGYPITLRARYPFDRNIQTNRAIINSSIAWAPTIIMLDYTIIEGMEIIKTVDLNGSFDVNRATGVVINGDNVEINGNFMHGEGENPIGIGIDGEKDNRFHSNVKISNNYVYRIGVAAMGLYCLNNCLVDNNEFARLYTRPAGRPAGVCPSCDLDYVRMFGNGITFRNNKIHNSSREEMVYDAHVDGIQSFCVNRSAGQGYPLTNTIIENNFITDADQPIWWTASSPEPDCFSHNVTLRNNIIIDRWQNWARMCVGCGYSDEVYFYNNIVIDALDITVQNRAVIKNNIFLSAPAISSPYPITWPQADYEISNNILLLDGSWLNGIMKGIAGLNTTNIFDIDPNDVFEDFYNGNFHIKEGSLAINAGEDLSATGFNLDYEGALRPQGSAWDIGAYEASAQSANQYYVRTDGSDTSCNGRTDAADPQSGQVPRNCAFRTVQKGVDSALLPGDTVNIRGDHSNEGLIYSRADGCTAVDCLTNPTYITVQTIPIAANYSGIISPGIQLNHNYIRVARLGITRSLGSSSGSAGVTLGWSARAEHCQITNNHFYNPATPVGSSAIVFGADSRYNIVSSNLIEGDTNPMRVTGHHTGAVGKTLSDSYYNWTVNQWQGRPIWDFSAGGWEGTSVGTVVSNDEHSIVTSADFTWNTGDCYLVGTSFWIPFVISGTNNTISNNTIRNFANSERIFDGMANNTIVSGNEVSDLLDGSALANGERPVIDNCGAHTDLFQLWDGDSVNVLVENNYFHDLQAQTGILSPNGHALGNWTIRNNIFANIAYRQTINGPGFKWYSNTIYNVAQQEQTSPLEGWMPGVEYKNNIIIGGSKNPRYGMISAQFLGNWTECAKNVITKTWSSNTDISNWIGQGGIQPMLTAQGSVYVGTGTGSTDKSEPNWGVKCPELNETCQDNGIIWKNTKWNTLCIVSGTKDVLFGNLWYMNKRSNVTTSFTCNSLAVDGGDPNPYDADGDKVCYIKDSSDVPVSNNYYGISNSPAFDARSDAIIETYYGDKNFVNGEDPRFVAAHDNCVQNACDFHLGNDSPLIGKGADLSLVWPDAMDKDGKVRGEGGSFDIGAYEYLDRQINSVCNNSIVESGELCDGNLQTCLTGGYSGIQICNSQCNEWNSCALNERCGDGVKNGNEGCDDENSNNTDLCMNNCLINSGCLDVDKDGMLDFNEATCNFAGTDRCIQQNFASWNGFVPNKDDDNLNINYNQNEDLRNVSNFTLQKEGIAEILFTERMRIVDVNSSGCFKPLNLSALIKIFDKRVIVYSDKFSEFQKGATIVFENVSFIEPIVLRGGVQCSQCNVTLYDPGNMTLIVNVLGFSTYEVVEGYTSVDNSGGVNGGGNRGNQNQATRTVEQNNTVGVLGDKVKEAFSLNDDEISGTPDEIFEQTKERYIVRYILLVGFCMIILVLWVIKLVLKHESEELRAIVERDNA